MKRLDTEQTAKEMRDYILSRVEFDTNGGCWLWPRVSVGFGYGALSYKGHRIRAHRASYGAFKGPIPDRLLVCHKCDVPACCNPDHLFLGTYQDNVDDMFAKGRNRAKKWTGERSGEGNTMAKLTWEKVREIRSSGLKARELAGLYSVSVGTIGDILSGRKWKTQ